MKTTRFLQIIACLALCGAILCGCKEKDVDLANIDPQAEVNLGLALPIGTISASIGDFLGDSTISSIIQVREDGVLFFKDTFSIDRYFHKFVPTDHISSVNTNFFLTENGYSAGSNLQRNGSIQTLNYTLTMPLNDINDNFSNERIDKISLKSAGFTAIISTQDLGLRKDEIVSITLILGKEFICTGSNEVDIPFSDKDFGESINVTVDEFTLDLMKNPNAEPSNDNVKNALEFGLRIKIKPSDGEALPISNNSGFNCKLKLEFLDYYAIYGVFAPSPQMRDEDTVDIAEQWAAWNTIKGLKLQLAEPEIKLHVKHHLSIPLIMYGNYLFTKSADGTEEYATFDGDREFTWPLENTIPTDAPLADSCINTRIFNQLPAKGELNRLFKIRPDLLGYKFHVEPDFSTLKQGRITSNTDINIDAETTIPFIFDPGVEIGYSDTITDVDISGISLDSLTENTDFIDSLKTSELKLYITAENWIPFDIKATFRFLDENMNDIQLTLTDENTLNITGPTKVENRVIIEPGKSALIISIDKDKLEELTKVKNIIYEASLGENTATVRLLDSSRLKLQIGIAANVDAILNLQANKEGGNQ